jgi:hypothetical protein
MKTSFVTTLGLIGTIALILVVRLHSVSSSPSPIRIVTSSGVPLKSLFDGVSPTEFGSRSVEQLKDIGVSRQQTNRGGRCRSAAPNSSTLEETFGSAHLVRASCFEGGCSGHYALEQSGNRCQNCATTICQFDLESGDPNMGCQEKDIDCFGNVCCTSNITCDNACLPGECF